MDQIRVPKLYDLCDLGSEKQSVQIQVMPTKNNQQTEETKIRKESFKVFEADE